MREFKECYKVIELMVVIMVMRVIMVMVVMNFSFLIVFFPIKINFQLCSSATINQ